MKQSFSLGKKEYDEIFMEAKAKDQFFTHPVVAQRCYDAVTALYPTDEFDNVLEPSAGNGSFYNLMPKDKRIGVDLDPQLDGIIKSDFFKYTPECDFIWELNTKRILCIGNPPFGRNSKLAIEFFNHASSFCDTIAFVIPRTWRKYSVQSKLSGDFGLYYDATLPYHSFYVADKPWHRIRCCFQVWSRKAPTGSLKIQKPNWKDIDLPWDFSK